MSAPVLWFTGLSGSGKSTIANRLYDIFQKGGIRSEKLDGDLLRASLCRDLGFTKEDRHKNIERAAFVANLLSRHGVIVLCTFITPYQTQRDFLRSTVERYIEIYVNAPLETCEERDIKGLYRRARKGDLPFFTGVSDVYELPKNPDIELHTDKMSVEDSVEKVFNFLKQKIY